MRRSLIPQTAARLRHSYHLPHHSRRCLIIPAPRRLSRESGKPYPGQPPRRGIPGFWIPACAGMTVGEAAWRANPPNPPFAKGGLFVGAAIMYQLHKAPAAGPLPGGEGWVREKRCTPPTPVSAGVLDSGRRRNDGGERRRGGRIPPTPLLRKGGFSWGASAYSVIPSVTPSFPRKRESIPRPIATPRHTGVLDSGLRWNDGGGMAVEG